MPRHLLVTSARKLSYADGNIIIERDKDAPPFQFPLEDIDVVLIEEQKAIITTRLLAEAAKAGTNLIFCGPDYLPIAESSPIMSHYNHSAIVKLQLTQLPYKRKKFWEYNIKQKIANQIAVLQATVDDDVGIDRLRSYLDAVKPGDETNMEGVAAREYFQALFGQDFARFSETPLASALNYGYSIVASCVIRNVAVSGLSDSIGVWHDAAQNAHNLSYDLIEPFRQVVDYWVYCNRDSIEFPLSPIQKRELISLLDEDIVMCGQHLKLHYAISQATNAFVSYLKSGSTSDIKMPIYRPGLGLKRGDDGE